MASWRWVWTTVTISAAGRPRGAGVGFSSLGQNATRGAWKVPSHTDQCPTPVAKIPPLAIHSFESDCAFLGHKF